MKRVIRALLVLLVILLMASCSDNATVVNPSNGNESNEDVNNETETPAPSAKVYGVNELIEFTSGLSIQILETRSDMGAEYFEPDEGNEYFYIMIQFVNNSDESENISSFMQFELKDDNGIEKEMAIFAETVGSLDGTVLSGDKMTGEVAYELPIDLEGPLFLYFSPDLFSDPIKIKIK